MQRSRFRTGALENLLNVTNPGFQETPSGPGGPSREGLDISETKFREQPTSRQTSAFVAGPLQTWLQKVARVPTWWALSRRPANCCLNSSHGSAPSLARGSRRHCPLFWLSGGPMRKCQSVSIEKGPFNRYPTCHRFTDCVEEGHCGTMNRDHLGEEGSTGRPSRSCVTRYGTRGPGNQADRNAKTNRHGSLAGDDGASHRRRPSSLKGGNRCAGTGATIWPGPALPNTYDPDDSLQCMTLPNLD